MRSDTKINILVGIGIFLSLFIFLFAIQAFGLFSFQLFGPKFEAARRRVFEQTKSYNQGMIQELENMQFQYEQADEAHRDALRAIILHRAADFDEDEFPTDLRAFIWKLRSNS